MRGRPARSIIRQNILEILFYLKKGYGYQIARIYNEIFPKVTQRSIYYHLRKGVLTQEIIVQAIKQEQGEYSWGKVVEKTYYSLGKNANPVENERIDKLLRT